MEKPARAMFVADSPRRPARNAQPLLIKIKVGNKY
jgi:hypothetical protein